MGMTPAPPSLLRGTFLKMDHDRNFLPTNLQSGASRKKEFMRSVENFCSNARAARYKHINSCAPRSK